MRTYSSLDELPATMPVFPLTGAVLLPRGQLPLNIFEPRYLAMADVAAAYMSAHVLAVTRAANVDALNP